MGFSVVKGWQGRSLAVEALKKVLEYLTENEDIPCVTAWCAEENTGSRKVLERAGMKLVCEEKHALIQLSQKSRRLPWKKPVFITCTRPFMSSLTAA